MLSRLEIIRCSVDVAFRFPAPFSIDLFAEALQPIAYAILLFELRPHCQRQHKSDRRLHTPNRLWWIAIREGVLGKRVRCFVCTGQGRRRMGGGGEGGGGEGEEERRRRGGGDEEEEEKQE